MEFKRDHALQQKFGQSNWRIFTLAFLTFVFLLSASSCKCDDQALKDQITTLQGSNESLSATKTDLEQKNKDLTAAKTTLENEKNSLTEQLRNQRERIIGIINEDIRRKEEEKNREQAEIERLEKNKKPETPKVMKDAADRDINARKEKQKRLEADRGLLTELRGRVLAPPNSSASANAR
jgi:DNA repair exonuclease SbcCD ATPase subunit